MVESIFLVTKTPNQGAQFIDGVFAVVINKDDAQTTAQIIADAVAQYNAGPGSATSKLPTGYFDTVVNIFNLVTGPLQDNKDCYVFYGGKFVTKVEG